MTHIIHAITRSGSVYAGDTRNQSTAVAYSGSELAASYRAATTDAGREAIAARMLDAQAILPLDAARGRAIWMRLAMAWAPGAPAQPRPDQPDHARDQAKAQVDAIVELMGAYNLDWDRLEELRDADPDDLDDEDLGELTTAAAGFEDQDAARLACYDNALSVELRSGWYTPGSESTEPEEARIVLCTGGPHVELQCRLDSAGGIERVRVLYQDWGTGPTEYFPDSGDRATLLQYCELVAGGLA